MPLWHCRTFATKTLTMHKQDRQALSEEMHHHIDLWQQSKTTQKQYCIANNLSYPKFIYWLQKSREAQNPVGGTFVPVKTRPTSRTIVSDVEITYPNGVRLRLSPENFEHIGRLIRLV
jgi:hypothetical protein